MELAIVMFGFIMSMCILDGIVEGIMFIINHIKEKKALQKRIKMYLAMSEEYQKTGRKTW